jgi:hypothetical protein
MRRTPAAIVLFILALATSWVLLLLLVAQVDLHSPVEAANELTLPGSRFHPVFGSASIQLQSLRVDAAAPDFYVVQSTTLADVVADDFPILHYRFTDFPRTMELSLIFRTVDAPDDVQSISLPRPEGAESTFDLSRIPSWRGTITELGFAQFPTAQLVPPAEGFQPFVLVGARLESQSWRGRLSTMFDSWRELRPWQLISISAVGPGETSDSSPHAPRLPLVLAFALLPLLFFGWTILRVRGVQFRRLAFAGVATGWLLCDLSWQRDLAYKRATDSDIWKDIPVAARQDHVSDTRIREIAMHVRATLGNGVNARRVLVSAPTPHDVLRLIWHAAPLNVGVLAGPDAKQAPVGTIIVRYAEDQRAVEGGLLEFGGISLHVRTIEQQPDLGIYAITDVSR